jgi:hypothetical protein
VFDVADCQTVESAGVNTSLSEYWPGGRNIKDPKAKPLITGTGPPRSVPASLTCTVPAALKGTTFATGKIKPPNPKGSRIRSTDSLVFVALASGPGTGVTTSDGDGLRDGDGDGVTTGDGLGDGDGKEVTPGDGLGDGVALLRTV